MAIVRSMLGKLDLSGSSKRNARSLSGTPRSKTGGCFCLHLQSFWYNVDMSKQKDRMSYGDYRYIIDLIEVDEKRLEADYRASFSFISSQDLKATKNAYACYQKKAAIIRKAKQQFQEAVKASYKDHPSKKMREFWGVPPLSKE